MTFRVFETGDARRYLFCQLDPAGCDTGLHVPVLKRDLQPDVARALRRGCSVRRRNLAAGLAIGSVSGDTQDMTTTRSQCRGCGRRVPSQSVNPDAHMLQLCVKCLAEAELENEHNDYGHDEPVDGCPECGPVAERRTGGTSATKVPSTAEVAGVAECQKCHTAKPLKAFPTKKDRDGVYVRDARVCRQCKAAR